MIIKAKSADSFEIKTKLSQITLQLPPANCKVNDIELAGAGEYEIADVEVRGFPWGGYMFKSENFAVLYLDGAENLSPQDIEAIDDVDVAIVPANAYEIVNEIEPKVAIPFGDGIDKFCKNFSCDAAPTKEIKINAKDLEDQLKVVVLKP